MKIKQLLSKAYRSLFLIHLPFYTNNILIIRLDNIGDYILFRNGLKQIRISDRFKNRKITLLGNKVFKDIAENFDNKEIDNFIWIDPKILNNNLKKIALICKLKLRAYHTIINPVHHRYINNDLFIKYINAKQAIGSKGHSRQPANQEKQLSESCYTELIDIPGDATFEFFRNVAFIENLTQLYNSQYKLEIALAKNKQEKINNSSKIRIVIVPGASAEFRRWSTKNILDLIINLNDEYNKKCIFYLTGSKSEIHLGEQICRNIPTHVTIENLIGKTTLLETIEIVNNSDLLISNETGTVHIAAALKTPAVCISNGNDFGRFNPYPSTLAENIITLYPIDNFYKNELYQTNVQKFHISDLDINDITVQSVFEAAKTLIEKVN
ncbi:glycosyltransferase family 9 protein [Mucilaginibacter arboris]|uniref:ADP-heptose:LPS heptosyltransferase n=1 Tax=Mucilaginibacter arboris TaxID=2682090 RepID=A0A7K1SV59_9SPHI|nr:glycosyltransferase family 9 protein [Mucilaginibacter arboris]MVN21128.1 hypothetical protein [Mucilaginibacter arboris]